MAVTLTVADFRAQFPEFASTDDAHIMRALTEALLLHSVRKLATLYAAAHVLSFRLTAISGGGGSSGGSTSATGQLTKKKGRAVVRRVFNPQGHDHQLEPHEVRHRRGVLQQYDIQAVLPGVGTADTARRHRLDGSGVIDGLHVQGMRRPNPGQGRCGAKARGTHVQRRVPRRPVRAHPRR